MRITPFLIVVAFALILLVPLSKKETMVTERQAQEEAVSVNQDQGIRTLQVRFDVHHPEEAPIADIIWIKKAAEVAMESGTPYFNILKQEIRHRFSRKYKMDLPVVHGIIQLEDDPMRAEYDAHEIESLILSNSQ